MGIADDRRISCVMMRELIESANYGETRGPGVIIVIFHCYRGEKWWGAAAEGGAGLV